jgi:hypothetical protein
MNSDELEARVVEQGKNINGLVVKTENLSKIITDATRTLSRRVDELESDLKLPLVDEAGITKRLEAVENQLRPVNEVEVWFGKFGAKTAYAIKNFFPYFLAIVLGITINAVYPAVHDWAFPKPVPVVPVVPNPPPVPPLPPSPMPAAGFRVLIVYDSSVALPSAQQAIITGKVMRDYLTSKTVPTPDGEKRGFYIVDKSIDFAGESKIWQDAMARPRTSCPWVVISNGVTGFEGPLPADVSAMMTLLQKYGG